MSVAVGRNASNIDGEIMAIEVALAELVEREYTHIVLLIDSRATIAAVTNPAFSTSDSVSNCKYLLERLLFRPTRVVLQGNEEADNLAKLGAQKVQPENAIKYLTSKKNIKGYIMGKLQEMLKGKAEGKIWGSLLDPAGSCSHKPST
ncbi:uncharacterized protein [Rhodnius prolixus]|uniref:uncharacterized protein n=1 Tax=Rhodnius prolixus TaxID=13249 RepID=UPI003D188CD2